MFSWASVPCAILRPAEQLQQKDQQILLLLEEKEMIFRDMALPEDGSPGPSPRALFRSATDEALRGAPLMKSAISEGYCGSPACSYPVPVLLRALSLMPGCSPPSICFDSALGLAHLLLFLVVVWEQL